MNILSLGIYLFNHLCFNYFLSMGSMTQTHWETPLLIKGKSLSIILNMSKNKSGTSILIILISL